MFTLLTLSLICLIAGPLVLQYAEAHKFNLHFLDAFVAVSVGGLILFHVLPESISHGGTFSIVLFLAGLVGPFLYGHLLKAKSCHLEIPFLILTLIGLVAHSILDGMALFQSSVGRHQADFVLGLAILLHRFPEGIGIWRFTGGSERKRWFFLTLALVMASTISGFFFGGKILSQTPEEVLFLFQAFMAGALMHVLFHSHHHEEEAKHEHNHAKKWFSVSSLSGAAFGILLLAAFSFLHPLLHEEHAHDEHCSHNHASEHEQEIALTNHQLS